MFIPIVSCAPDIDSGLELELKEQLEKIHSSMSAGLSKLVVCVYAVLSWSLVIVAMSYASLLRMLYKTFYRRGRHCDSVGGMLSQTRPDTFQRAVP